MKEVVTRGELELAELKAFYLSNIDKSTVQQISRKPKQYDSGYQQISKYYELVNIYQGKFKGQFKSTVSIKFGRTSPT